MHTRIRWAAKRCVYAVIIG